MQHDNHPKQTRTSTSEWLKDKKFTVLEVPELVQATPAWKETNVTELKWIYMEDGAKIPPQHSVRLSNYC